MDAIELVWIEIIQTKKKFPVRPEDTEIIRNFLKDNDSKDDGDPIHDQATYLTKAQRDELSLKHNVKAYTIVQYLGDAIFIPAGAAHQVRNIFNCIKVSPENVTQCFKLTKEFRKLPHTHTNNEDIIQIKATTYHACKVAASVIMKNESKRKRKLFFNIKLINRDFLNDFNIQFV